MDTPSREVVKGSESCHSSTRPVSAVTSTSSGSRSRVAGPRCDCGRAAVSKYCLIHEVVCCTECCFDKHKECVSKVEHLKEVVKDAKFTPDDEQGLIKKLAILLKQRQDDLQKLLRQKDQMKPSINKVYDHLRAVLNEMQEKDNQAGEEKFHEFDTNIKQDIEDCSKAIDSLKAVSKNPNKEERFVKFKQAEVLSKQLEEHSGNESLEFLAQDSVGLNLKSMKCGYFLGDVCIDLVDHGAFKIQADDDKEHIKAMCEMPDGTLVVATDTSVKHLDHEYEQMRQLKLKGHARDLCCVGDGEIAICVRGQKQENILQFVTVPTSSDTKFLGLQTHTSVALPIVFLGRRIACLDQQIFIQDPKYVRSCDKHGKDISVLYQGSSDNGLLAITADQTRKRIYIADKDKGIVMIDKKGKVLLTVSDPDFHDINSFCIDKTGQFFVACRETKRILLLNKTGQKRGVAKSLKEIGEPYRVAVQKKYNRLLISLAGSCELMVYSLPSPEFYSETTR